MKTCPVCDAKSFDDAQTCFSCMHRFDEDAASEEEASVVDDPPAHLEPKRGPLHAAPLQVQRTEKPLAPELAQARGMARSDRPAQDAKAARERGGRLSGRTTLRRGRRHSAEAVPMSCFAQQLELPQAGARYELVVGLQPVV